MNIKELVVSFREKLLALKHKLTEEVKKYEEKANNISRLRNIFGNSTKDLYTILMEIPNNELMEFVQFANVDFTIEDINKFKYILSEDIFKGTYRYKEAKDSFEALANALRVESVKRIPTERIDDISNRLELINQLLGIIKDGKFVGSVDNFGDVMELFDFAPLVEFTDEEKEEIIKQLLLSDLTFLKNSSDELENKAIRRQEDIINESDEVVVIDDIEAVAEEDLTTGEEITPVENEEPAETPQDLSQFDNSDVPTKDEKPNVGKYRSVVSLDKENILNSIGLYADKIIEKYAPKSPTHEEHFNDLAEKLINKELDLEILRSILIVDKQFAYVLAVYLRNLVVSLNDFLDTEDELDEAIINDLYDEQMGPITDMYELLKKLIEKIDLSYQNPTDVIEEQAEIEEDNKFKIVFVKNGIESYFSKSLFELRAYENIGNVERILVELENGMFSGDRKVGDYKYKMKGSFAIFYKVKSGHIFVFNVILSRDLGGKKTDNVLSILDYTDELNAVLEKGPEYRKLMEDSQKEREELRVMLGVALNEPQV